MACFSQTQAHAHNIVSLKAEAGVEVNYRGIRGADLYVELGASQLLELCRRSGNHTPPKALPLPVRRNGKIVQPAAMPVIAHHNRSNNLLINCAYQKQVGLHLQLEPDVMARVVPRHNQVAAVPKLHNLFLVAGLIRPDVDVGAGHGHPLYMAVQPGRLHAALPRSPRIRVTALIARWSCPLHLEQ